MFKSIELLMQGTENVMKMVAELKEFHTVPEDDVVYRIFGRMCTSITDLYKAVGKLAFCRMFQDY